MGWSYDYVEERRGDEWSWHPKALFRPAVLLQVAPVGGSAPADGTLLALVDSGCDHVLAPEWVARMAGVEPDPNREVSWVSVGSSTSSPSS